MSTDQSGDEKEWLRGEITALSWSGLVKLRGKAKVRRLAPPPPSWVFAMIFPRSALGQGVNGSTADLVSHGPEDARKDVMRCSTEQVRAVGALFCYLPLTHVQLQSGLASQNGPYGPGQHDQEVMCQCGCENRTKL
jgi:hypothetical protein